PGTGHESPDAELLPRPSESVWQLAGEGPTLGRKPVPPPGSGADHHRPPARPPGADRGRAALAAGVHPRKRTVLPRVVRGGSVSPVRHRWRDRLPSPGPGFPDAREFRTG